MGSTCSGKLSRQLFVAPSILCLVCSLFYMYNFSLSIDTIALSAKYDGEANTCPPRTPENPRPPCSGPGADPEQKCCSQFNNSKLWGELLNNFSFLGKKQAYAGAYGCDDCCHVSFFEKAWLEYETIAKVKTAMANVDPYHLIFGTIACDNCELTPQLTYCPFTQHNA